MKIEQPITMKIEKIIDEAKNVRTFQFNYKIKAKPGQFILLWMPRINMKPFGISYLNNNKFCITVCEVGPFTEKLFEKKQGELVGIQGAYGKGFSLKSKNAVLVAGGYGAAPLSFLADELAKAGTNVTFIIGAKCDEELVYKQRFKENKVKMIFTTDDGSYGKKGFATEALIEIIKKDNNIDQIYTCGPEPMIKKVFEICEKNNIKCEASLEKYIKCGIGICDECSINGLRVCKDGPVFDSAQLREILK